jgi:hypothetical protein
MDMDPHTPIPPGELSARTLIETRLRRYEAFTEKAFNLIDADIEFFRAVGRDWHRHFLGDRLHRDAYDPENDDNEVSCRAAEQPRPLIYGRFTDEDRLNVELAELAFSDEPIRRFTDPLVVAGPPSDMLSNYVASMTAYANIILNNSSTVGSIEELNKRHRQQLRAHDQLYRMRIQMYDLLRKFQDYIDAFHHRIADVPPNMRFMACVWWDKYHQGNEGDETFRETSREWTRLQDWVASFPETKRLVANGRPLRDIVAEFLDNHQTEGPEEVEEQEEVSENSSSYDGSWVQRGVHVGAVERTA